MSQGPITPSMRHLYCVPAHTHALLRFRVHRTTPSHVAYWPETGVAVDRLSGDILGPEPDAEAETGPVRFIARVEIDADRAWEGAPPDHAAYYSSFGVFQRLQELALVRYGVEPSDPMAEIATLEELRQRMMDAHPDRGGDEARFSEARRAYDSARKRLGG